MNASTRTKPAPAAASCDELRLCVSLFSTAMPTSPAIGDQSVMRWDRLVATLRRRREGQKDGPNFVPARFKLEPDGRARRLKANVLARTAIVLDIEANKQTGEVPPTVTEAARRIEARGWTAVVYTSHSHVAEAPRYRVVLPISAELDPTLPAPEGVAMQLQLAGVLDTSKIGASSLFYLPSAAPGHLADHETIVIDGAPLDAGWLTDRAGAILAAREAEQAMQRAEALAAAEKRRAARLAEGMAPADSLIERIRDHLDLEGELLRHGYVKHRDRYLFPKSETGIPGVFILRGNDGTERVFSHHAGDPLHEKNLPSWCTTRAVDAVDAAIILGHGSDRRKGLHALAKKFQIKTPRAEPKRPEGASTPPPPPPLDNDDPAPAQPADDPPPAGEQPGVKPHFTHPNMPDYKANIAAAVDELNAKYFVVNEAGKAIVYAPSYDPILRRQRFDRISFEDLQKLYLSRWIAVGINEKGNTIFKNAANIWLRDERRRQFIGGVRFDPSGKVDDDIYNLWSGYAVTPRPGDWSLLRQHIRNIICAGVEAHFTYLMGWLARLVQHPAEQGEVAVVMKGAEGTGKGTLAKALLKITGQHGIAISNAKHLVGNFNAHLRDAVLLFADEAFFAGDRAHVGVLKSIITEPYLTIEGKFQNAVQMPNFLHVMMASNEEWVVPASLEARRFFVLNVLDAVKGDHTYFAAIIDQLEHGGYEAMLHDLLAYDLTGFNVRAVPQTEGLQQQRTLSLPTPDEWWLDVVHRGYVYRSKLGLEQFFSEWHETVSTEVLFASYTEFAKSRNERHPMPREAFGRFMVRMGGKDARPNNSVIGEHITDVTTNDYGDTKRTAALIKKARATGYSLGTLAAARAAFTAATGLAPDWPIDGDNIP